ncbi:two-component sensor histidine kinase [Roseateles aquatilis]|uniref:Sensor protein n=1 Tax=Roseateles aquatilis TaxID=431061 RepID=A0A246IW30_9BURK|nr:heavy metal sensor histidine kinase [Roseateles aquatilis]OWQ84432.1 two-component sensor histidine kinase [Roseateles aquatilis]
MSASLRGRLSRWLALQTMLGLGLVCTVVYLVIALTLSQRQDEILAQKRMAVQGLLTEARGAHEEADVQHLLNDFLAGHDDLSLIVSTQQGRIVYQTTRPLPPSARARRVDFDLRLPDALGSAGSAVLAFDRGSDQALLRRLAWTLLLTAVGGALAVSAGAWVLVRIGLAPLRDLVDQTARVNALRLDRRLDGQAQAHELQPLIGQFNALLDRLAVSYGQMEAFNADVAHELNTPLSTLIGSCEIALRRSRPVEELREVLASNLEDLRRMAGIVADMLFLSNAERGHAARRAGPVPLATLAEDVIDFHEAALQEAGLRAEVRGDAFAAVDAGLVRRALSNLLGNATRYARPASTVLIHIEELGDGQVRLSVRNEGATIPAEHLPRLFDRFYRVDPARSAAERNHGLGLSIVAAVARMHGGVASAESAGGVTRIGLTVSDR